MTLGLLCSGQGGQHAEMFRLTGDVSAVMDEAARVLGRDARQAAAGEGRFENRTAQVLCCAQALAAWSIVSPAIEAPVFVLGYSVGELAAYGCAGWFGTGQVLRLAAARAAAMDAVRIEGAGLAGVVGLRRGALEKILAGRASVAIVNGADSIVVGGAGAAFEAALEEARAAGGRVRRLRVGVASHTPLMAAAAARFGAVLADESLGTADARVRLVRGIDGLRVRRPADGLEGLAAGLARTIAWADCVETAREAGVTRWLELGPGDALARMAGGEARSVDAFRTVDGLLGWVAQP